MRGIKVDKTQKVVTDKDGKVRLVEDYEKQRRMKPAGQQFWKKDTVKVKK